MKSGIFNTDNNWLSVLRKNSIREGVNFWRKDKRTLHLPSGSPFYFKDEWEFNGPFLKDFFGNKSTGDGRDVGAIEYD